MMLDVFEIYLKFSVFITVSSDSATDFLCYVFTQNHRKDKKQSCSPENI